MVLIWVWVHRLWFYEVWFISMSSIYAIFNYIILVMKRLGTCSLKCNFGGAFVFIHASITSIYNFTTFSRIFIYFYIKIDIIDHIVLAYMVIGAKLSWWNTNKLPYFVDFSLTIVIIWWPISQRQNHLLV